MHIGFARFAACTILSAGLLASPAAHTDEAMLKLLDVLRDNGTISEGAYEMLKEAAQEDDSRSPDLTVGHPTESSTSRTPAEKPGAVVELDEGGVEVRSASGESRLRLGGRLHVDGAVHDDTRNLLGDGSNLRRLRAEARAALPGAWSASSSIDFAGNDLKVIYAGLEYSGFENKALWLGRRKQFFSLDELTSSNNGLFMERAMLTEFAPGTRTGIAAMGWGDRTAWSAGLFADAGGVESEPDAGWGLSTRAAWFPVRSHGRLVHLGGAISYWDTGDDGILRLRARPESRVTNVRLVDTGDITGVNDIWRLGLEAATVAGPLTVQSEYVTARAMRGGGLVNPEFSGWYASTGWLLTGESRGYRSRVAKMGGVVPGRSLGDGGIGAWEIAARYSTIDLTDGAVAGGVEDNLTLGLNWYASPNIRFMFNYVNVLDVDRPDSPENGSNPEIYQLRAQFNY